MKTLLINKYYCRQEGRGTNPVASMQKGDETPWMSLPPRPHPPPQKKRTVKASWNVVASWVFGDVNKGPLSRKTLALIKSGNHYIEWQWCKNWTRQRNCMKTLLIGSGNNITLCKGGDKNSVTGSIQKGGELHECHSHMFKMAKNQRKSYRN